MEYWSTSNMKRHGHAEWLVRTSEKIINTMRDVGGLPSTATQGYLVITVPTLLEQARVMNAELRYVPGKLRPTGVVDFED